MSFTPDGRRLAMTTADRNVTIWDAENGRQLLSLAKHSDAVTAVAFSPDGLVLATSCADGSIKSLGRGTLMIAAHQGRENGIAEFLRG